MKVISNNIKNIGMEMPKDAVVRINIAWIRSLVDLELVILNNKDNDIWLDYPTGRRKPPVPTVTWQEAIAVANKYSNVKYFAFSNGENPEEVKSIREQVPTHIKLIPKIETVKGIKNLLDIVKSAKTDTIMLDGEDLYTDLKQDAIIYGLLIEYTKKLCTDNDIKCLSLQGVIFA